MWVNNIFYATLRQGNYRVSCMMLVGTLKEDRGKDVGSWTQNISTPSRKLEWPALTISTLLFHPH